jgi:diguanylate cyclase (GGDEF)-like protein
MLDVDQFKYVNDTLGHHAGDKVIVAVAELLATRLRSSDLLARLGGDEFAVLLPKANARTAEKVAEDLLGALREQPITISGVAPRAITASVGVATFDTELTGEDVLVNADLAMYDAKEAGRDRVATFDSEGHEQARMKGRLSWVQQIRAALEQDRFSLVAQPIVELSSGRVVQQEALLRMLDDRDELIPPGAFLYIAERLDMIQEIDAWVVRNAFELLAADPNGSLPLEINISARSIGDPRLIELIERQIEQTGIAPERLIFEITETAAIEQIGKARAFSQRLADLGCRLALDDFGAGFGSFYYLKHLTFDYLKIDGEFIHHCTTSKTDQLVIRAIVDIARGLDKTTIAEYVTDGETARLLTRLGVDYGQGYHYGRPTPFYRDSKPGSTSSTRAPVPPSTSTART